MSALETGWGLGNMRETGKISDGKWTLLKGLLFEHCMSETQLSTNS